MGLCSYLLVGPRQRAAGRSPRRRQSFPGDKGRRPRLRARASSRWSTATRTSSITTLLAPATRAGVAGLGLAAGHPVPARRRGRQVGPVPAAHLAAGRDGGPDAGLGADPRRDHGGGRCLPRRPAAARRRLLARRRATSWPPSPASRCWARPWRRSARSTSSGCSPTPRSARSPTCWPRWRSPRSDGAGAGPGHRPPARARGVQGPALPRRRRLRLPGRHDARWPAWPAAGGAPRWSRRASRSAWPRWPGVPPLSGFWSKEAVLGVAEHAARHGDLRVAGVVRPGRRRPHERGHRGVRDPGLAARRARGAAGRRRTAEPIAAQPRARDRGAPAGRGHWRPTSTRDRSAAALPAAMRWPLVVLAVPTVFGGLLQARLADPRASCPCPSVDRRCSRCCSRPRRPSASSGWRSGAPARRPARGAAAPAGRRCCSAASASTRCRTGWSSDRCGALARVVVARRPRRRRRLRRGRPSPLTRWGGDALRRAADRRRHVVPDLAGRRRRRRWASRG